MEYKIRKRELSDCKDIARVVTISWNETYKGIVPDWFLEELKRNEDERAKNSIEKFDKNNNNQLVLEVDGKVVGFANFGKSDDKEYENCGEIFALYIIGEYKGKGYGRKLVNEAINELKKLGYNKMIIACLKGNPTNEFYKHIGGVYVKDGLYKRLSLAENVYYFENI